MTATYNRDYPILILFAHPDPLRSRVNRRLKEAVEGLPGVRVNDLYENYPAFHIDVVHEQGLLREAQLVVFQHPFYWYSAPPILKQWQDVVLTHGFAHGSGGTALSGKQLLSVISTGHRREAYTAEGEDHYTMGQLLRPYQQCASRCGMLYEDPLILHWADKIAVYDIDQHALRYRERLEAYLAHYRAEGQTDG